MPPWLPTAGPDGLLVLAAVMVGGALAGEWIARATRLPRVVGYTLAGCVMAVAGMGPKLPLDGTARLIVDLALALLLFEIGSRVRLRWLRRNPGLLATSLTESLLGAVAVFGSLAALGVAPKVAGACAVLAVPGSTTGGCGRSASCTRHFEPGSCGVSV